jgi:hypothetical protein
MNGILICILLLGAFREGVCFGEKKDLESFEDEKEFKALLKTRPNFLVLFSKSGIF